MKVKCLALTLCLFIFTSCQMLENSPATGTLGNRELEIAWQKAFGGELSDWIASDETIYVLDKSGQLTALNAAQGEKLWQSNVTGDGPLNLTSGSVIVANWDTGVITSIDRDQGNTAWSISLPKPNLKYCTGGGYVVTGTDIVFAGCYDKIYALDSENGHQIWEYRLADSTLDQPLMGAKGYTERPFTALVYAGKTLYVRVRGTSDIQRAQVEGRILALNADTGEAEWQFAFYFLPSSGDSPTSVSTPVLVGNNYLFLIAWDGQYYFIDRKTGTVCSFYDLETENPLCTGQANYNHEGIVALGDYVAVWDGEVLTAYSPLGAWSTDHLSWALPDWRHYQAVAVQSGEYPTLWQIALHDDTQKLMVTGVDVLSSDVLPQYYVQVDDMLKNRDPSRSYAVIAESRLVLARDQYTLIAVELPGEFD